MLQDFTSSSKALIDGIMSAHYGNNPRALDALFAALDGGFENTTGRRVILLLSAGVEGRSGTPATEVFELARRRKAIASLGKPCGRMNSIPIPNRTQRGPITSINFSGRISSTWFRFSFGSGRASQMGISSGA